MKKKGKERERERRKEKKEDDKKRSVMKKEINLINNLKSRYDLLSVLVLHIFEAEESEKRKMETEKFCIRGKNFLLHRSTGFCHVTIAYYKRVVIENQYESFSKSLITTNE